MCVVLGHIVQYLSDNYDENHLFRYIYAFHMPLFMMISGYVSSLTEKPFFEFALKKAERLIIPFVMWGLVTCFIYREVNIIYLINLFVYPDDGGLWFLWVLFFISIVYNLCLIVSRKYNINRYICLAFAAIILFVLSKMFHGVGGSHLISWYFIFYVCGSIVKSTQCLLCNRNALITLLILFFCLGFYWKRTEAPIQFLYPLLTTLFTYFYKIVTALIACLFFFSFYRVIDDVDSNIQKILQALGEETLGIYAVHFYLVAFCVRLGWNSSVVFMAVAFVLVSALSFVIVKIIKLNKYFSFIFLGTSIKA